MSGQKKVALGVLLAGALLAACADSQEPVSPRMTVVAPRHDVAGAPAPTPLNPVYLPTGDSLKLWPYTGDNFTSATVDPINLAFPGRTPMEVRAALMALDGNRSTLPAALGLPGPLPPEFQVLQNCTWKDAAGGGNQTAYSREGGWAGSAIQLTCGVFQIRFHVRLFSAGSWTLGGAHFEVQIPGLPNHASLSWDRAQQFVAYDMNRTGRLDTQFPLVPLPTGSQTPTYRTIEKPIYDGLPAALQWFIGAVVSDSVRIPNDGFALAFNLASVPAIVPMVADQDFTLQMGQVAPKPFCATSPYDYVYVTGPMHVTEHVEVTPSGNYFNTQRMEVQLTVFQFDLGTMSVTGAPFQGTIVDVNNGSITGSAQLVTDSLSQSMYPAAPGRGTSTTLLRVGAGNSSSYSKVENCNS